MARKEEIVAGCSAFILYRPLRTEIAWENFLSLPQGAAAYTIEPRASLDPAAEALAAMHAVGEKTCAVLLPGRRFDASGTRHGQGGGWYDRFLARVPSSWVRIGFCAETQFSKTPLQRNSWDQPVDVIYVIGDTVRCIETKARLLDSVSMQPRISLIAALNRKRVIGCGNTLLWHIPDDLKRFKELTLGHPVVMGRKTFESILAFLGKPLPGRTNIVVTRDMSWNHEGVEVAHSLEEALEKAGGVEEIFIIGGGQIYGAALPLANRLYLTLVESDEEGDAYFPEYEHHFTSVLSEESHEHDGLRYRWINLERQKQNPDA